MSTDASGSAEPTAADLRTSVVSTLREEFPQLRGAERAVQGVDPDSGVVTMSFGCGCSGGISDAAKAAIENRLVNEVEGISGMTTESGCGCGHGGGRGHDHGHSHGQGHDHGSDDSGPEAPF